jgi:hypothetical protein
LIFAKITLAEDEYRLYAIFWYCLSRNA